MQGGRRAGKSTVWLAVAAVAMLLPGAAHAAEREARSDTVCAVGMAQDFSLDRSLGLGFQVVELDFAKAMAVGVRNSLELVLARADYRRALGDYGQARSPRWANVSFSGTGTAIDDPPSATLPLPVIVPGASEGWEFMGYQDIDMGSGKEIYSYGVNITQPVYTGGMLRSLASQGRLGVEIARQQYYQTAEQVILDVKTAYYEVLKAQHLTAAAAASLRQVEELWLMAEDLFAAGTAPEYDAIRAWVQRENVCGAFIQASEYYEFTHIVLGNVLKLKPTQWAVLEDIDIDDYEPKELYSIEQYYLIWSEALANRREIKQAELLVDLRQEGLKTARSERLPRVFAVGSYGVQQSREWPPKGETWSATLSVEVPIFDNNMARSKVRSALAGLDSAETTLQAARDGITVDYSSAVLQLRSSRARVLSARQARAAAEQGLEIAKLRYKEGLAAQFELTDAEAAWSRALTDYFTAVYDYEIAYARFLKARGIGLQGYEDLVPAP